MRLFECVPNFSEGRDPTKIEEIVAAGRSVEGVTLLDVERNADHNRSVVTFVGEAGPVSEAAFRMIRRAVELIDLNHHRGEHPRMGAADVVPFVPLGDSTTDEAVGLAHGLAERVWNELQLPAYLYADAARRPERRDLGQVRKGQFEGIRDSIATDASRAPDVGEPRVHPTAGIVAIGARPVLIAYNAYLTTADVRVAKRVAHAVRGRDGGLAEVKALGFDIRERQRAQVSMNLTDYRKTPVHRALDLVRREAAVFGAAVEESEVVGLIPEDALLDAAEYYLQLHGFDRGNVLERKLRAAERIGPFVVPRTPPPPSTLGAHTVAAFAERLAARTPTPGGGSASAVAGALGAALAEMVLAYASPADQPLPELAPLQSEFQEGRRRFLSFADEDAHAYESVRETRRRRRASPTDAAAQRAWTEAVRKAAEVPMETARLAARLRSRLEEARSKTKPSLGSDLVTALALLDAARNGALANAAINMDDLREAGLPVADLEAEMQGLAASAG
jgi:glutamate formiminotransferase/formiminotetrahydrofolate cyclodeaminase